MIYDILYIIYYILLDLSHEASMLAERVGLHEASCVERLSDGAFVSNQIEPGRTRQGADGSQIERQAAGWLAGWLAG